MFSALLPTTDIAKHRRHVGKVPNAKSGTEARSYFVGSTFTGYAGGGRAGAELK